MTLQQQQPHQQHQLPTGSPPKHKEEAIAQLLDRTGFAITSENGQRRYSSPSDTDPPAKGAEVFVGKLPRDCFEDELVPLFEKAGRIRELRLMMESGPQNRGFAFVAFAAPDAARAAIDSLDGHELRKGRYIGVCKSVDNCRLFVGGIPKSKTRDEILEEMRKVTDAVEKVILYSSVADKSKNRGFAFVEYESHKAAAAARRKLIPGKIPLFGHEIAVDWAEPEPEVDEETMSKVTVLYVRNLMMHTTEDDIKRVFSMDDSLKVEKVKKLKDFAFVHFKTREDAEDALEKLSNTDLDGSTLEVTWAKPADRLNRPRCHSRPSGQHGPPVPPPFLFAPPGFDPSFSGPFANCPGRGGMLHRVSPFRGRGRGAAGIRRFRNFVPHPNHIGAFKSQEVGPYGQYSSSNKLPRNNEKGEPHEYVFMPLPPNSEGLEAPIAVPGPPLVPHHRVAHPGFIYPPPPLGYEDVPYLYFTGAVPTY